VTWAVLPADAGTISRDGLYTAPAHIDAARTVVVVATGAGGASDEFGTAVLTIVPD
jgi:hypothetical protein